MVRIMPLDLVQCCLQYGHQAIKLHLARANASFPWTRVGVSVHRNCCHVEVIVDLHAQMTASTGLSRRLWTRLTWRTAPTRAQRRPAWAAAQRRDTTHQRRAALQSTWSAMHPHLRATVLADPQPGTAPSRRAQSYQCFSKSNHSLAPYSSCGMSRRSSAQVPLRCSVTLSSGRVA